MTNGQLFIKENPTVEIKINGSCVWIYFDGVNHYTMPTLWWDKEISLFDKIRNKIEQRPYGVANNSVIQGMKYERVAILEILDKYKAESKIEE